MPLTLLYRFTGLRSVLTAALLLWLASAPPALAQPAPPRDSAVKAAFLHRFPGYIEWPAGTFPRPETPLVIGISGNEAVAADLEQIAAGRTAEGRPLSVRRLREGEAVAGLHVLLVGARPEPRVRDAVAAVYGPVLVVTEQDGGLDAGAALNFVIDAGRVRFTASQAAAEARGLRLSARLLAVAQSVDGRPR